MTPESWYDQAYETQEQTWISTDLNKLKVGQIFQCKKIDHVISDPCG